MNAEITYNFLERFTTTVKIDYCLGVCKLIMMQLKESSPEEFKNLHKLWEETIRQRFELNMSELEKLESMTEQEKKMMYSFMENLVKEINNE